MSQKHAPPGSYRQDKELSIENPDKTIEESLVTADILDLIDPNPSLVSLLYKLKENKILFLMTSSPQRLAVNKLDKIGISPTTFNYSLYRDSLESNTSDGKPFDAIIKITGKSAEKHVYIGDRLKSDILPAKNIGMKTIAIGSDIEEADLSLNSINDIGAYLL